MILFFRSDPWDLPPKFAIPWLEIFDDLESEEAGLGGRSSSTWESFSEKTKEEEEAIEALLLEATDEAEDEDDLEALMVQAEQEASEDLFMLEAAEQCP